MILVILFLILFIILVWGHYGLPEKTLPRPAEPKPEDIMAQAEPFVYEGKRDNNVGVLLIHGFEGSPYTMRHLGKFLNNQGYHVIAPLLPGHGTNPNDFAATRYYHWYQKVDEIYKLNRPKFRYFFIIGLSMGGNLTLKLAETHHDIQKPSGIVVLSAPVFFNGFFNGKIIIKDWRLMLSGIISHFNTHIKKPQSLVNMDALSPWIGYSKLFTIPCLHSLKRNVATVRNNLWKINIPILLIHASNDKTVDSENQVYIFNHVRSREKLAYSFTLDDDVSTRHLLTTHQRSQGRAYYYIEKFILDAIGDFEKVLPEEKPTWMDKVRLFWGD